MDFLVTFADARPGTYAEYQAVDADIVMDVRFLPNPYYVPDLRRRTGQTPEVREFVQTAFDHAGLDWQRHVRFDERYLRPTEVDSLVGDATKAARSLGWKASIHTAELARIMVEADMAALECDGKPWIDKPMVRGWS